MNEKTMYAVCVAKEFRSRICKPGKFWVKNETSMHYFSIKDRGLWETEEDAMKNVIDSRFEKVVKVIVPNPGHRDGSTGQ